MDELQLLERYFVREIPDEDVVAGIGDDAAVLSCSFARRSNEPGYLVVTADTLAEGSHFEVGANAEDIGYKSLAVSLSDIAAMGASPKWATLCLSLPHRNENEIDAWVRSFSSGFFYLATRWGVALVGGDLAAGALAVTVQVGGVVGESGALLRSGAVPGDGIYVTGSIGDAGLAWRCPQRLGVLGSEIGDRCIEKLWRPVPRISEGRILSRFASAAIDVSDGVLLDLLRLLKASDVSAKIDIEHIPLGRGSRSLLPGQADWSSILTGGEDYELLFTMADENFAAVQRQCADKRLAKIARIGQVVENDSAGPRLECTLGGELWPLPEKPGFDHFSPADSETRFP